MAIYPQRRGCVTVVSFEINSKCSREQTIGEWTMQTERINSEALLFEGPVKRCGLKE
jgi:hypothetical protein